MESKIKILVIRPNEEPVVEWLDNEEEDAANKIVGGWMEVTRYAQPDLLVCNEEGKLKELEPNRVIYRDGELIDVVVGAFFICGIDDERNFASLTEEKIQYYKEVFALRHVPKDWNTVDSKFFKTDIQFHTF